MTIHDEAEKAARDMDTLQFDFAATLIRTLSARLRAAEAERDAIERQFSSVSDGYSQLHVALEEAEDWNREAEAEALPAVRVKPLVWQEGTDTTTDDDNGPMEGIPRKLQAWRAGGYTIIRQDGPHGLFILKGKSDGIGLIVHTLEAAKAAAQADYESRIISAAESLDLTPVREAIKAVLTLDLPNRFYNHANAINDEDYVGPVPGLKANIVGHFEKYHKLHVERLCEDASTAVYLVQQLTAALALIDGENGNG